MFVVRRTFRDNKGVRLVGSIVESTSVKRFKHRIAAGNILEITEQNLERYQHYFSIKHGVDITANHNEYKAANIKKDVKAVPEVKATPDIKTDVKAAVKAATKA